MDLRQYIEKLKAHDELQEITVEVDWNLEAGAVSAMNARLGGPALWFKRIKGYPTGYGLAANLFSGRRGREWMRHAIAIGLDPNVPYEEFAGECMRRLSGPIKPIIVESGPCKEEIHVGPEVNLLEFPWPYLHKGDAGRYGTIETIITKDYYTNWVNWGNYRALVHGRNKIGVLLSKGQQCAYMFYEHWEPHNVAMPFCIAVGGDPVYFLAACSYLPEGFNEVDAAGALTGAPVELVKAETNDLYVPADSEIVIEGEVRPGERMDEGPFGEYFGFIHGPRRPMPVWRVMAITHRKNPIMPFVCEGLPRTDGSTTASVLWSAGLLGMMRARLSKAVTGVFFPLETPYSVPVVGLEKERSEPGTVGEIGAWLQQMGGVAGHEDQSIVVDGHIKPWETNRWLREFALKADPLKAVQISAPNMPKVTLNVYQTRDEIEAGTVSKIHIDATSTQDEVVKSVEDLYSSSTLAFADNYLTGRK